jgi:hypothetical protein
MDDLSGKSDKLNKKSESSDNHHILPGDDAEKSSDFSLTYLIFLQTPC